MRYFLIVFALVCCSISSWAQSDSTEVRKPMYSVRHGFISEGEQKEIVELEAFRQRHLFLAGEAMQKEIGYMATSAATSVISGVLFGLANQMESKAGRTAMFITGGVTAGLSLVGIAGAIHFHTKAGRELRLSAGEVIYKF